MADFVISGNAEVIGNLVVTGDISFKEQVLPNQGTIKWRNFADTLNLTALKVDSSDILQIGSDAGIVSVNVRPPLQGVNANSYAALNEVSSATNPTLIHNRADLTSGIGGVSGSTDIIAGGVQVAKAISTSFTVQVGMIVNNNLFINTTIDEIALRVRAHSTQTTSLARFERDDQTILLTVENDGQLVIPIIGSAAGILIGGDAQWYRDAADVLRTPDSVTIDVDLSIGGVAYHDAEFDNGIAGAADTIDWNNGNKQRSTLDLNTTYTFTNPPGPASLVLRIIQDVTGTNTVTWPASVKWEGGTAPVITPAGDAIDVISFYYDGTDYYGSFLQDFS